MFRYDFAVADLLFRVESPMELQIPEEFQPFKIDAVSESKPDVMLDIVFETVTFPSYTNINKLSENVFRCNNHINECYLWRDGEYIIRRETVGNANYCRLFIPKNFANAFCAQGKWLNYVALDRMLLPHNRFYLHASAVVHNGKVYLFSAPSGEGKSTHADLWEKHFGATILNGDKALVYVSPNGCVVYGSPLAGSSGIYCNDSAPLAAIIMLQKAHHNKIFPITGRNAFLSLYSESIKSSWDTAFNCRLLGLLESIQNHTPMYSLECLPEKSAVECVLQKIEGIQI